VDLVLLNDAPPELGRAIVTRGRRVHCADADADHACVRDAAALRADRSLHNDVVLSLRTVTQLVIDIAGELAGRKGLRFEDYTEAVRAGGARRVPAAPGRPTRPPARAPQRFDPRVGGSGPRSPWRPSTRLSPSRTSCGRLSGWWNAMADVRLSTGSATDVESEGGRL
jgi:hypothetical protein